MPLSQGKAYYRALKRTGVPVDMVTYPKQGHMIRKPRLQRDMLNRNLRWFLDRLLGQ